MNEQDFCTTIRRYFDPLLQQYGYRAVPSNKYVQEYASERGAVLVYLEHGSLAVIVAPSGLRRRDLYFILGALHPELGFEYARFSANELRQIEPEAERLSEIIRRFAQEVLWLDAAAEDRIEAHQHRHGQAMRAMFEERIKKVKEQRKDG